MYSYYQREIGKAKKKFQELLNDVDDELLTALENDGTISILDIQGVGRDVLPKEESVESSRKRKYEVIQRCEVHYERVKEIEIETTGDDELDRENLHILIKDWEYPDKKEFPQVVFGDFRYEGLTSEHHDDILEITDND